MAPFLVPLSYTLLISVPFIAVLPPTPLEELLAEATLIIVGETAQIISQRPDNAEDKARYEARAGTGWTGPARDLPDQTVKLAVREILRGKLDSTKEILVLKPWNPYLLEVGQQGVFFLAPMNSKGEGGGPAWHILNLYGPYPVDKTEFIRQRMQTSTQGQITTPRPN